MIVTETTVKMYDTDMAGVIFYGNQFRYIHDAIERLFIEEGLDFVTMFTESPFAFVIAHAESDYLLPLSVGDKLRIELTIEKVGKSSLTLSFDIFRDKDLVGRAKTVQVCIDRKSCKAIPIPDHLREKLLAYH